MKKRLVILSGAGISAESGLRTFRDSDGLWEEHSIYDVATPQAWVKDQDLVLRFYNARRTQLAEATPNAAHKEVARLEEYFDVDVITQNVDDLHERGGSTHVLHLHGELTKVRSSAIVSDIRDIGYRELKSGELCGQGHQLRPHIVWFGEDVPLISTAAELVNEADFLVVVGTSLNVYPAAGLKDVARPGTPVYLIDPDETMTSLNSGTLTVVT